MSSNSLRILTKMSLDAVCLTTAIVLVFLQSYLEPYKRGFFCDDDSIRYLPKKETVSSSLKNYVGTLLPILVVLVTEIVRRKESRGEPLALFGVRIPGWVINVYRCVGVFGFGACSSEIVTGVGKITLGRLRPHFYEVCQPNIDCTDPALAHHYIEDYTCEGDEESILQARKSFPSGHSSYATYTMLFTILYLEERYTWKSCFLLKYLLQLCCFSLAWFVALTRISDYMHHPTDVLGGQLIGIIFALIAWISIRFLFKDRNEQVETVSLPNLTSLHLRSNQKF